MTHAELVSAIKELCDKLDLLCVSADGKRSTPGAFDLVIFGKAIWCVEVKSEDGRRTTAQIDAATRIVYNLTEHAAYRLYRPADWTGGIIEHELKGIA